MGTHGTSREDGEIDFTADELAEMQVDVAGREESAGAKRRKRAMRVPADEVPRSVTLTTEPNLDSLPDTAGGDADELVEHAFSNGGRVEAEVRAQRTFARGGDELPASPRPRNDTPATVLLGDDDLVPDVGGKPELAETMSKMAPNVRALMRALAPEPAGRPFDSQELEQLDSAELEAEETPELGFDGESTTTETQALPSTPPPVAVEAATTSATAAPTLETPLEDSGELTLEDSPQDLGDLEAVVTAAAEVARAAEQPDAEEVAADDVTVDEDDEKPAAKRPLPPAMPAEANVRARSVTPLATPTLSPLLYGGTAPQIAPAVPPLAPPPPPQGQAPADELRPRRRRRVKQWFEEIFDDDYLRTLPYLSAKQTEREAAFVAESLELAPGASILDVGCGYGRHAMELAGRGNQVTGIDLSLPLLIRAADAARRIGVAVNFVHGDMREMTFEAEFDGAYCLFTSFGYFDDDTNRKVAANLQRALKPGGRVLIELVNRDYITRDLPTRVWWQGDGCVVLEEVDFNYFSSRLQVQRSIIFEDGRQLEQEISIRAYSLHEIGKVLHHAGFRVIEVSGGLGVRGKFFGAHSRQLIVLAEKKASP